MVHIGNKISQLMRKEKIDSPTLGRMIGMSKQAVYQNLQKRDLNTSFLRKISTALDVPLTYFVSEDSEPLSLTEKEELIRLRGQVELLREMAGVPKKDAQDQQNAS